MKTSRILALLGLLALIVIGCGLVSGTVFIDQEVTEGDETISARSTGPLDDLVLRGIVVNLTDNGDLDEIDVDGIEDICVVTVTRNNAPTPVEGEVWISTDTLSSFGSPAEIQAAGGFRIFHGIALNAGPNEIDTFTCMETLSKFENLDLLAPLIADPGYFKVYVLAPDVTYDFEFSNVHLGMHVTGSL